VALLALGWALSALHTYAAHHLTAAVLATGALAVTLLIGLGSLGWARWRIERELAGLRSGGGELLEARRQRLQAIARAGIRPDRAALAEATAAEEAGRAYFGRYLVATTVLLGLVGTFAGLMETLERISPMLTDREGATLSLLAAPLGGLHVTFGASLVAILGTLALALAQGDLTLHEDLALALLEERTTHQLIPGLWPAAEDAAERTVRAIDGLKNSLSESLARALDSQLTALTGTLAQQLTKAAGASEAQAAATTRALETQIARLCESVATTSAESARRQATAIADAASAIGQATRAASEELVVHTSAIIETSAAQTSALVEKAAVRTNALVEESLARSAALVADSVGRSTSALEAAVDRTTGAAAEALRETSAVSARALRDASTAAAGALRDATLTASAALRETGEAAEGAVRSTTGAVTKALEPLFAAEAARLEDVRAAVAEAGTQLQSALGRLTALEETLSSATRAQVAAIDRAGQSVLEAIDRAVLGGGAAIERAAGTLASAASELGAAATLWQPTIGTLTTELGALGREVALLAARPPENELGTVVLGELERLGDGVDRLRELVQLAAGNGVAAVTASPALTEAAVPGETATDVPVTAEEPALQLDVPVAAAEEAPLQPDVPVAATEVAHPLELASSEEPAVDDGALTDPLPVAPEAPVTDDIAS
jgi:hypothetical protein